jgi:hypothetical protein
MRPSWRTLKVGGRGVTQRHVRDLGTFLDWHKKPHIMAAEKSFVEPSLWCSGVVREERRRRRVGEPYTTPARANAWVGAVGLE